MLAKPPGRIRCLSNHSPSSAPSRFDEVEFGASWEDMVRSADRFPSSKTTIGLGRSFAWNHWARVSQVVDDAGQVRRDRKDELLRRAFALQAEDNALDRRLAK